MCMGILNRLVRPNNGLRRLRRYCGETTLQVYSGQAHAYTDRYAERSEEWDFVTTFDKDLWQMWESAVFEQMLR